MPDVKFAVFCYTSEIINKHVAMKYNRDYFSFFFKNSTDAFYLIGQSLNVSKMAVHMKPRFEVIINILFYFEPDSNYEWGGFGGAEGWFACSGGWFSAWFSDA